MAQVVDEALGIADVGQGGGFRQLDDQAARGDAEFLEQGADRTGQGRVVEGAGRHVAARANSRSELADSLRMLAQITQRSISTMRPVRSAAGMKLPGQQ